VISKPPQQIGTASRWHFRLAAGALAAAATAEFGFQSRCGAAGAGPLGWLALLGAASWALGLIWRERVGVLRAWMCFVWVVMSGLVLMRLGLRWGSLSGGLAFTGMEAWRFLGVPLSAPLLWWVMAGGGYLVVEGLWGEWRAGVSALTALVAVQQALMVLPFQVSRGRGYWRWDGAPETAQAPLVAMPWAALGGWFVMGLGLALGLVVLGDNWSRPETRTRRQAWVPAAVLLVVTAVCLSANLAAALPLAVIFSTVNLGFFGAVVIWYLRDRSDRRRIPGA